MLGGGNGTGSGPIATLGGGSGTGSGPIATLGGGSGTGSGPIATSEAALVDAGPFAAIALRSDTLAKTTSTANTKVRM